MDGGRTEKRMNTIRAGVVGIGNMGSAHAMSIYKNQVDGMELAAVCDNDPDRLSWARENFGAQILTFSDYKQMFAAGILDAVVIATPHFLHPVIATEAFASGLHVLTEKPAGVDIGAVRRMNEAAAFSGKIFAIMYNQRTNPLFRTLKEYLEAGKLGQIKRFVWIINNWYRTQAYYDSGAWRATWNGEGGGVLLNQCPHNLDLWQWMMGMPRRLRAFCRVGQYHEIQVEDDVTIYAEYENGASASFITSTGEYPGTNRLEVSGTRGKAVIEDGKLRLFLLEQDEREICFHSTLSMPQEIVRTSEIVQTEPETGHPGILRNFAAAILRGEPLIAPGVEGIKGLTLSNAAYLSEWTDAWVELPFEESAFNAFLKEKQEQERTPGTRKKAAAQKPEADGKTSGGRYEERWKVRW